MVEQKSPVKEQILKEMQDVVGHNWVSIEPADCFAYAYDMTTAVHFLGTGNAYFVPDYVVLPGTVGEVQEIVRLMNKYKIPMYAASHLTNLAGIHCPREGGVEIDVHRMNRIIEVNEEMMTVTVEPGVTHGLVRKEVEKRNLKMPCLIGPYSGTLVGHCIGWSIPAFCQFGMEDRIVTLEAVLANGDLIRTGSAAVIGQENTNPYMRYALSPTLHGLFLRSVGTLGIVTRITFRLLPKQEVEEQVHIGFDELLPCISFMRKFERRQISLYHLAWSVPAIAHPAVPDISVLFNPSELNKHRELFHNWTDVIGLTGTAEQVKLYKKYVKEDAAQYGGEIVTFPDKVKEYVESVSKGGSSKIIRGYTPGVVVGGVYAKFDKVVPLCKLINEMAAKYGLKDPLGGEPYIVPQLIVPLERGTVWYVDFDPWIDQEDPQKNQSMLMEVMGQLLTSYEGSLLLQNPMLEPLLMPGFVNLWKGIKNVIDPNLLFGRGYR